MSQPSKRKRGAASGEMTPPEQLLDAASELMVERGSIDISLHQIAKRSGVNAALVGYYFGNKAGMYLELVRKRLGPGVQQLKALSNSDLSPREKLRIHIYGMVSSFYKYPYTNHIIHALTSDPDPTFGEAVVKELNSPVADFQRKLLQDGYESGEFRKVDPLLFYFSLVGACDQLFHGRFQAKHLFGFTRVDDDLRLRYSQHLYETLLNGIAA